MLENCSSDLSRAQALHVVNRKFQGLSGICDVVYNEHFFPAYVHGDGKLYPRFCLHIRPPHVVLDFHRSQVVEK